MRLDTEIVDAVRVLVERVLQAGGAADLDAEVVGKSMVAPTTLKT